MNPRAAIGLAVVAMGLVTGRVAEAQIWSPYPGVTIVRGPGTSMAVVDLCAGGIGMRATHFTERGATAPVWAARTGAALAVNADFFEYVTYYVGHRARGAGEDWPWGTQHSEPSPYVNFGPGIAGMRLDDGEPAPGVTDIVGGSTVMIEGGVIHYDWGPDPSGFLYGGHRRTGVGFSANRRTLFLMASDLSVGIPRMAEMMIEHQRLAGAPPIDVALNLDGGGSTQMYLRGSGALIGSTRAVASHLGVFFGDGGVNACPRSPFCPAAGARSVCLPNGTLGHCNDGFLDSVEPCGHGCRRQAPPLGDACWQLPRGSLDSAACDEIAGWTQDPNSPNEPNDVQLFIDGPAGSGARMLRATADEHRTDLCTAIGSCAHGFRVPTPYDLRDGREHTIYAYALTNSGAPANPVLGASPRMLRCAATFAADLDADGRSDVLAYRSDWDAIPVCLSTGAGWSCRSAPARFVADAAGVSVIGIVDGSFPLVGRFDDDRRADLVQWHPNRAATSTCRASGSAWSCRVSPLAGANGVLDVPSGDPALGEDGVALTADFNHDGRSDLIRFRPGGVAIPVCLSSGPGWSCRNLRANYVGGDHGPGNGGSAVYGGTPLVGDFDGDGFADLIQYRSDWQSIPLCRSTGAGWSCRNLRAHYAGGELPPGNEGSGVWPGSLPLVADFDGDGRTDVAQFRDDGTDALPVCLSLSTGWSCRGLRAIGAGRRDARDPGRTAARAGTMPVVMDIDGDGRAEILLYHPQASSLPACRWNNGWSCRVLPAAYAGGDLGPGNDGGGIYRGSIPLVGDFDGDGRFDLYQSLARTGVSLPVCISYGTGFSCRNLRTDF